MQFKNPEILYFLFLLVIPIVIHLFQLRKFKIEYFTNVQFLKQLNVQTRKSSKLKKYLLLASRLFLLTFLIIAFAQPFFNAVDNKNATNELYIILDNSFSMQAKGTNGALLKRAVEDLIEKTPENLNFSLLTCSDNYWNTNIKAIQKDLQNLNYSATAFNLNELLNKVKAHKSAYNKEVVIITDAIGLQANQIKNFDNFASCSYIISKAERTDNISIDSVFIKQNLTNFYEISVKLISFGKNAKNIPIALYNYNKLIAKTIIDFNEPVKTVQFTIPKDDFQGYVAITDASLNYDDTYYFGISKPKKRNIISIGEPSKSLFLSKIYLADEFNYFNYSLPSLDYNLLEKQDAVFLNELEDIPVALQTTLKSYFKKGGTVVLIPNKNASTDNLNQFLTNFSSIKVTAKIESEIKISTINFEHPLFNNVFEKKFNNFQYPVVKSFFETKSNAAKIVSYSNQTPFLNGVQQELSSFYFFSAALNKENSNFQNSPIIVPIFYNMALNNSNAGVNAYKINNSDAIFVEANLEKDAILKIQNSNESFIPLQQIFNGKVKITCNDNPKTSGNYKVTSNNQNVTNLSFNYSRTESNLKNRGTLDKNFKQESSIAALLETVQANRTDSQIWKWFVLIALLFFIFEVLIQKLVK